MNMQLLRRFNSLMLILIAILTLSSCDFINDDKKDPIPVTFPSYQHIYVSGSKNTYAMRVIFTGSGATNLSGTLTMDWDDASLADPLESAIPTTTLFTKFTSVQTITGSLPVEAIQYLEQLKVGSLDSMGAPNHGSQIVYAFESPTVDEYWVDVGEEFTTRESIQTLFSPFQPSLIDPVNPTDPPLSPDDPTVAGERGKIKSFNFGVMGNCEFNSPCIKVATVTGSFQVVDEPLQVVSTLRGDYLAYKVRYNMLILPNGLDAVIDFRASCAAEDFTNTVSVFGEMFVSPDIGPLIITNTCNAGNGDTSYEAILSDSTFLP